MSKNPTDQNDEALMRIVALRLAVGMLGERDNAGWWTSGFLSSTSTAFLAPVFGSNVLQARYQGVLEAAKRVHDERIGVGHVFHLFRLPESVEQRLFEAVQSSGSDLTKTISSADTAKATLESFGNKAKGAKAGPALMASSESFDSAGWLTEAATLYSAAFGAGVQCFPYSTNAR